MRAVPSLAAAFATFSRVPVPQRLLDRADWTGGALAALPAVGAVQGLVSGAWLVAAHALGVPAPVVAAVLVALPFAVNGGIHMDGFSDVADARSSHAARERKLEIMKDPHIGAFGVMAIVLYLLMQHPGMVFTREQLQDKIWGYEFIGESRTVDVHIRTLRQKLGGCGHMIETVRGVGYRFTGDVA